LELLRHLRHASYGHHQKQQAWSGKGHDGIDILYK
jgi:hypothetical protein